MSSDLSCTLSKEIFFSELEKYAERFSVQPEDIIKKTDCKFFNTIGSTNTELRKRLENTSDFHKILYASAEQTSGRGRLGRNFYSPAKDGIYFSVSYATENGVTNPAVYTATAAVAVCRAIESVCKKSAQIKWVNDIYLSGKKVCGILTEGVMNSAGSKIDAVVIGIGINLRMKTDAPQEVLERASGIFSADEEVVSRETILSAVICELIQSLDTHENCMSEYRERSMLIGKTVRVTPVIGQCESYEAEVQDVSDDASLVVKCSDGTVRNLSSGEVTLHG